MKKLLLSLTVFLIAGLFIIQPSQAQTSPLLTENIEVGTEATDSGEATPEATLASPSAETIQKIQEQKDQDITQAEGEQKSKLVRYLEENPLENKNFTNLLQQSIRNAVEEGVPPNVIVLVLLFPLFTSLKSLAINDAVVISCAKLLVCQKF
jgi:dephospho-CoA kinase